MCDYVRPTPRIPDPPPWRRMRKVACPPGYEIQPWDTRYYALYKDEELICVTVYKTGAVSVMKRLADLNQEKRGNENVDR